MASTYFKRTGTTTVNTYTFSAWIKIGTMSSANNTYQVLFSSGNQNILGIYGGPTTAGHNALYHYNNSDIWYTNNLLRDPSSWYHVVAKVSSGTVTTYINGVQTSYATSTYSLGALETTADKTCLGCYAPSATSFFRGSMANVEFVSGTALGPEYFGSTDTATGIWKPGGSSAISDYGADGFKLVMNTSSPQNDTSGKGNNFTLGGGTPTLLQGSPSNVWCTWNPNIGQGNQANMTYSKGNTSIAFQSTSNETFCSGTIAVTKGKWYWEWIALSEHPEAHFWGVIDIVNAFLGNGSINTSGSSFFWGMNQGTKYNGGSGGSYGTQIAVGTYGMVALDMDNGKIWLGKDGTWFSSANPASNDNNYMYNNLAGKTIAPMAADTYSSYTPSCNYNFGEGFFGTNAAGTESDDNGQGLFKYDPPAGFYAMNTKNLEAYG